MTEKNQTPSPGNILVVDDDERNRKLLITLLEAETYRAMAVSSGAEALSIATVEPFDLIILDIMMPGMDGYETVARLKANAETKRIPVIMLTSLDDRTSKLTALEAGAEEFLTKPIDRIDLITRVRNLLRLKEYGDFLARHNEILAQQVQERTAQLESAYQETLFTLLRASEFRDEDTGAHIARIGLYSERLARAMNFPEEFCETIRFAAPMHDIGKIGIPDGILMKPGSLTVSEWRVMRTHCELGAEILGTGQSRYLLMGIEIARSHHEQWTGKGYPDQLAGEAIPISARVAQIGDVYDALRSKRPYKPALDHETAVRIITKGDGRSSPDQFDGDILAAFTRHDSLFNEIFEQYSGNEVRLNIIAQKDA